MVMPLALLDVLVAAEALDVLPVVAPFRWPRGWKLTVGRVVEGAEESALKLMRVPSSWIVSPAEVATICRRGIAGRGLGLPPWRRICRSEAAQPVNNACLTS
jgi:hypothetical protein